MKTETQKIKDIKGDAFFATDSDAPEEVLGGMGFVVIPGTPEKGLEATLVQKLGLKPGDQIVVLKKEAYEALKGGAL